MYGLARDRKYSCVMRFSGRLFSILRYRMIPRILKSAQPRPSALPYHNFFMFRNLDFFKVRLYADLFSCHHLLDWFNSEYGFRCVLPQHPFNAESCIYLIA